MRVRPENQSSLSQAADWSRVLGASAIFYYHAGIFAGFPFSSWGEYAVAFFFVLSGLAYTNFSSVRPADWPSYRKYLWTRLTAIFPVYWAVNGGIYLASYLYPSALGRPFSPGEFVLSALGVSEYFHERYLSTVMWFVPVIVQAYLIFPLLEYWLKRITSVPLMMLSVAAAGGFAWLILHWQGPAGGEVIRNWTVIYWLPEVCAGMILGRAMQEPQSRQGAAVALLGVVAVAFAAAHGVPAHGPEEAALLAFPWRGLVVTGLVFAGAVLFMQSIGPMAKTKARLLRLAGTASFPFYLAHGTAMAFVFRHCGRNIGAWLGYFLTCWGGAIVVTLALSRRQSRSRTPRPSAPSRP